MTASPAGQDDLYAETVALHGAALERLARAYEFDAEARRDLLQEIHIALWRSFHGFNHQCSLRTWIYRVAHNTATSHVSRQRRIAVETLVGVEELASIQDDTEGVEAADRRHMLDRLLALIHRLKPLDRQVMLAYLEGMDAGSIAELCGISSRNVATKTHRIKQLLARRFQEGKSDAE